MSLSLKIYPRAKFATVPRFRGERDGVRGKDSRIMQQLLGMAGFSPNLLPGVPGRGDKPFTTK